MFDEGEQIMWLVSCLLLATILLAFFALKCSNKRGPKPFLLFGEEQNAVPELDDGPDPREDFVCIRTKTGSIVRCGDVLVKATRR